MAIPRKKVDADAALLERAAEELGVELSLLLTNFRRELERFIRNPEAFGSGAIQSLAVQERIYLQLDEVMQRSGIDSVLTKHIEKFPLLTDSALSLYEEFGDTRALEWVGRADTELTAAVTVFRDQLVRELDTRLVAPIQSAVVSQVFVQDTSEQAIESVLAVADNLSVRQATRVVDDQYLRFSRAVKQRTAEELGLKIFVYSGPLDKVTSPQCREILTRAPHGVPGYWKKEEIKPGMVPDAKFDPLLVGGHPNCRHQWLPVTEEEAKADGFKG